MVTILKASQEYEGAACAVYDVAYRKQAVTTGHRRWLEVNTLLYAACFTGKGKKVSRSPEICNKNALTECANIDMCVAHAAGITQP